MRYFVLSCLVVLLTGWLILPSPANAAWTYPLKLAGTGKNQYLVDQTNQPFMINGDTAWSLIAQLNEADAQQYLADRSAKGFNLVLVNLIEHEFALNAPANFYNEQPFTTPGDFTTPNEAYFARADKYLNWAAQNGLTVLLAPTYLGYGCSAEGWCVEIQNGNLAMMTSWGHYLGNRYKNVPNLIWVVGGDEDPNSAGVADKLREFARALKETDPNHLITAHNVSEEAALDIWNDPVKDTWLNLNNVYTYGSTYTSAATQYTRANFKPFFLVESAYENEHSSTLVSLRSEAYWSILAGSLLGHLFGNCPLWNFGSVTYFCTPTNWKNQLNSAGSQSLPNVGKLFMSRPFYKLVPDQTVITSANSQGSTFAAAARASDGSTVIIYSPSNKGLTINLAKVAGSSVKAWWFKPADATTTLIGSYPNSGSQTFTPASSGDWVLVLDNADLSFPTPGQSGITPTPTPVPGDFTGDGKVDYRDWLHLVQGFTANAFTIFDVNRFLPLLYK